MYEITPADRNRGRKLKIGAIAAPLALTFVPVLVTLVLMLVAAGSPPVAAVILFFGVIATIIGFVIGISLTAYLGHKRSLWTREMREKIAANGIHAEEIGWFRKEMKASEKKALKEVEASDALLGDSYRDALASRLTATRIVRSSRREFLLAKRRQNSLKQLKSGNAQEFRAAIGNDIEKISSINDQAKAMLSEAEARLQMIEAAAARGGTLTNSELALKKLAARTAELPLVLESARMTDDIRRELEAEDDLELDPK